MDFPNRNERFEHAINCMDISPISMMAFERIAKEKNLRLIRPYDDPLVIAGQGTCGLEIATQAKALGIKEAEVLVCCGGGGLSAGIALALEEFAPSFYVRTCEPKFFDDTARSLRSGKREKTLN